MKALFLLISLHYFTGINYFSSTQLPVAKHTTAGNYKIEVKKNTTYKGNPLEAYYTVVCTNITNKKVRQFELIKTDDRLKNFFIAEFVIIEKFNLPQTKYYPLGWESTKIKETDLKSDCLEILHNNVKPIDVF